MLHDSRHTSATEMLQAGADLPTVGAVLGHSDRTMTMRYGHSSPVSQRSALEKLAQFGVRAESAKRPDTEPDESGESAQPDQAASAKVG